VTPDPLIGKKHPYYLGAWHDGKKEVTAIFCHEGERPERPVVTFEDGGEAFAFVHRLNLNARNKSAVP